MKGIVFFSILLLSISMPAHSAELYCNGKMIHMEYLKTQLGMLENRQYQSMYLVGTLRPYELREYLEQLHEGGCGVEGLTCFTGRDSGAYGLIYDLLNALYKHSEEIEIIGVYFRTGNRNTLLLKYKHEGQYNETVIRRCPRT